MSELELENENIQDQENEDFESQNSNDQEQNQKNLKQPSFNLEIRKTIIELLKYGSLSHDDRPALYKTLCANENEISAYLRNINILLAHSEEMGLAYIKNLNREEEMSKTSEDELEETDENFEDETFLISSRTMSEFDSVVLLVLRKFYQERYNAGENQVFIDLERINSLLVPYLDLQNSKTRALERINGSLAKFRDKRLVRLENGIYGDRVQILPLMRFVVNAEFMTKLLDEYHNKLLTKYTEEEIEKLKSVAEQELEANE